MTAPEPAPWSDPVIIEGRGVAGWPSSRHANRNRVQAQDSLQDQLRRVYGMALWHGEYDAADWMKERMT